MKNFQKQNAETADSVQREGNFLMREYILNLEKYGISNEAYKELRSFCLQYNEKKLKLNNAYSLKSPNFSGMPHGSEISDPTAKAAEIAEKYRKDIDLIENTAKEVDSKLAPFIIKNVTTKEYSITVLKTKYGMKVGENQFKAKRRLFYYLLAQKKQII